MRTAVLRYEDGLAHATVVLTERGQIHLFYWSDSASLLCAKVEDRSEAGYLSEREERIVEK